VVARSAKVAWSEVVRRGRRSGLDLPVGVMLARTQLLVGLDLPTGLLRDLGGDTSWERAMRTLARARATPELRRRLLSGQTIVASTRNNTRAGVAALVGAVGGHLVTRVRPRPALSTDLLHHEAGDASDREAFLAAVAEEERKAHACSNSRTSRPSR
jgi:hypothetical protein